MTPAGRCGWACGTPAPRCRPARRCCGTRWPRRGRRRCPPPRTAMRSCGRCTTRRCWITWPGCGRSGSGPGFPPSTAGTGWCRTCSRTSGMLAGLPLRSPPAVHGRAGRFCYDTMTLVGPGSWAAIRGAADAALTAADLVQLGGAAGLRAVPPAGPSRHPRRLRRLLLPQQRRDRRPGADRGRGRPGRRRRHRRAPRQRHPEDLLRPRRRLLRVACTSTRGRAGSRTTWATRTSAAPARARAPIRTCRCRLAPATRAGSRRCGPCARARPRTARTPSWSRSAWTPPRPIPRARCG